MYFLKIVLHNEINCPVYLDIHVPDELVAALRTSKITRSEFLIYARHEGSEKIVEPKLAAISELNNFKIHGIS